MELDDMGPQARARNERHRAAADLARIARDLDGFAPEADVVVPVSSGYLRKVAATLRQAGALLGDSQEAIDADAALGGVDYWGCRGERCDECPAKEGGDTPAKRYGVRGCERAQLLDLLRRQRELDAAGQAAGAAE